MLDLSRTRELRRQAHLDEDFALSLKVAEMWDNV